MKSKCKSAIKRQGVYKLQTPWSLCAFSQVWLHSSRHCWQKLQSALYDPALTVEATPKCLPPVMDLYLTCRETGFLVSARVRFARASSLMFHIPWSEWISRTSMCCSRLSESPAYDTSLRKHLSTSPGRSHLTRPVITRMLKLSVKRWKQCQRTKFITLSKGHEI